MIKGKEPKDTPGVSQWGHRFPFQLFSGLEQVNQGYLNCGVL